MEEKIEENKEEKVLEERKKKFAEILLKKNILAFIGLVLLLIIAFYIRTANVPGLRDITTNDYTLGPDLDPFLFLRYAKVIVEQGSLPKIDTMRYVPFGYNTGSEKIFLSYMIAYFHKIVLWFKPGVSVDYSAVMFPAFMFLLTLIAFFLMVRKIFEDYKYRDMIAFISSAFLVFSPSLLSRTIAGIPEKESVAFFFMFLSLYLFLSAWKSKSIRNAIILGLFSGLSAQLMGMVWGGWIYLLTTMSIFSFVNFLLGNFNKKTFLAYSAWILVLIGFSFFLSGIGGVIGFLTSTASIGGVITFFAVIVDGLIFKTKVRDLEFIKKARTKIPDKVISLIAFIIIGGILSSLFLGIRTVPTSFSDILQQLSFPYVDRLSFTVAENRQPYFDEWKGSFGPIIKGIPIFFWLFFLGSILLFYETIKNLENKKKYILLASYVLFIVALIFSRYSQGSVMNGESGISKILYFGSFLIFFLGFAYCFYLYYKEENLAEFKKINVGYLLIFSYFFVGIIGARSAIRLIMALSPPTCVIVGYFSVAAFVKARETKEEFAKIIAWVVAAIVIIATFYSLYFSYQVTYNSAKSFMPSIYTQQWQKAMKWVRDNTDKNAVFSHWWDYGYWLQSIGERATVLDGGNAISYWNHLIARYVLTGDNEKGALEFLYTHNVSYLLIDPTDIGKYAAYSNIGSDENYDRSSWIPTFGMDEKLTQELKNGTAIFYTGGTPLDQDFTYKDNSTQIYLPGGQSGIGAVKVILDKNGEPKNAEGFFVYKNQQYAIPFNCVYHNDKLYSLNKNGYDGCLVIIPAIRDGRMNSMGVGIFLTERVRKTLFAKLYLFNQGENFELVHSEDDFFIADLKSRNISSKDFAEYQGIRGPIKIWKVNYPVDIKENSDFLKTDYPKKIRLARQ